MHFGNGSILLSSIWSWKFSFEKPSFFFWMNKKDWLPNCGKFTKAKKWLSLPDFMELLCWWPFILNYGNGNPTGLRPGDRKILPSWWASLGPTFRPSARGISTILAPEEQADITGFSTQAPREPTTKSSNNLKSKKVNFVKNINYVKTHQKGLIC